MRKTISHKISLEGIGLHTGKKSKITFIPSPKPAGVRFIKKEKRKKIVVKAELRNVAVSLRGTNLRNDSTTLRTVEHILSAAAGLDIDDLDIEMTENEIPILDGSAKEFADALIKAEIIEKKGQKKSFLILEKEFEFVSGNSYYKAKPAKKGELKILYFNSHKLVGEQKAFFSHSSKYAEDIAPSRTFGFKSEIDWLFKKGLAKGGSLKNAVIISGDKFLSAEGGLRFANELARHKLLDLMGDLKLLGANIQNISVEAGFTGHAKNIAFANLLKLKSNTKELYER